MSVVSKKFSASLYSMLVLLLLCLITAFSSGCGSKASLDPASPSGTFTAIRLILRLMIQSKNLMPLKVKPRASLSRLLP